MPIEKDNFSIYHSSIYPNEPMFYVYLCFNLILLLRLKIFSYKNLLYSLFQFLNDVLSFFLIIPYSFSYLANSISYK